MGCALKALKKCLHKSLFGIAISFYGLVGPCEDRRPGQMLIAHHTLCLWQTVFVCRFSGSSVDLSPTYLIFSLQN